MMQEIRICNRRVILQQNDTFRKRRVTRRGRKTLKQCKRNAYMGTYKTSLLGTFICLGTDMCLWSRHFLQTKKKVTCKSCPPFHPSVRLYVTEDQRLKHLCDFHEIWCRSSLQSVFDQT
jgi:hypothetical protein